MYTNEQLFELYDSLFKQSLPNGAILAVAGKENLYGSVKGNVLRGRKETFNDLHKYTHFTPNTFIKLRSTDSNLVWGHSEDNLHAINAFVFDIDTKKHSAQDIATHCMDESVGVPTYVLETDRGLQFGFVSTESIYVNQSQKSVYMAKQIHRNLRDSLLALDIDVACLPFGFFRVPTADNTLLYSGQTYDVSTLMNWSLASDADKNVASFDASATPTLTVYRGGLIKHRQSNWYRSILNTKNIKGDKGLLGRNNVLFTLALACLQDGMDVTEAQAELLQWNAALHSPLKKSEVLRTIGSAFSGKYTGPSLEYVTAIMEGYCPGSKIDYSKASQKFYKHAKDRSERERSHVSEWETDIIKYVEEKVAAASTDGFFVTTQSELMEALNIPSSSLNLVLNNSTKILRKRTGKGRGSRTMLSTVKVLVHYILNNIHLRKASHALKLQAMLSGIEETPALLDLYKYLNELNIITYPDRVGQTTVIPITSVS